VQQQVAIRGNRDGQRTQIRGQPQKETAGFPWGKPAVGAPKK